MNHLPPSEFICFCDDKTADSILKYVDDKATSEQIAELKSTLTEYLEWSADSRGFDEAFINNFINALFSDAPKESLQKLFYNTCSDGFGLVNRKLNVLFCGDFEHFSYYCMNLNLDFLKTFTEAVTKTGLSPKQFAKKNRINFSFLRDFYVGCSRISHDTWISSWAEFVDVCEFLGITVKPIDNSPLDWEIDEADFRDLAEQATKQDCKKFAKLFSQAPSSWFDHQLHKKFEG